MGPVQLLDVSIYVHDLHVNNIDVEIVVPPPNLIKVQVKREPRGLWFEINRLRLNWKTVNMK